jgi:hypothetical protein
LRTIADCTELLPKTRRVARLRRAGLPLLLALACAYGAAGPSPAQADAVFTDLSLPTISGTPIQGQTLTEVHATWSTPPASYAYQWSRCNSSGKDCESIEKATTQSYRLTAADVGSTIRVGESATDSAGAVTPAQSEPTAVVKAPTGGEHQGESGGGGSTPPGSCCGAPAHGSPVAIKLLLDRQLVPSGRTASISQLLKHGGLHMSFKLPEAGTLVVQWYFVPRGAKLARKTQEKPVLVAAGRATFKTGGTLSVAIKLTAQGRKLLRHASRLDLEARGTFAPKGAASVSASKKFALKR